MSNIYPLDNNGNPRMGHSVVLFMDILGYKEIAEQSEELPRLWSALKEASRAIHLSPELPRDEFSPSYAIRTFTDNIVIGRPIRDRDDTESALCHTLSRVADYRERMAHHGYFVRGGIAIGDFYLDELVVFGPALLEAYELESKAAVYPRVILSGEAARLAKNQAQYYASPNDAPLKQLLVDDDDGFCFVNYLNIETDCEYEEKRLYQADRLRVHKLNVMKNLERHGGCQGVRQKYDWVAAYHNRFAQSCFPDLCI